MWIKRHIGLIIILFLAVGLFSPAQGSASPAPLISILSPGGSSFLTSPISLSAEITPEPQGMVRVTLTSRNGDLLARQLMRLDGSSISPIVCNTEIPFEIPSYQTEALLTLAIQDEDFRTVAIRSVLVTLVSTGEPTLHPPVSKDPWLDITHPQSGEEVSGGELEISGSVTPISNRPISFELVSDSGRVIGSSQLSVITPDEELDFEVTLYYSYIKETTNVRFVIRQNFYPYDEAAILDSVILSVAP